MKAQALPLDLPDYIEVSDGDAEPLRYFLTINRTAVANWSAAYKEFDDNNILLAINYADTLEEIATRLGGKLERHAKQFPDHKFVTVPQRSV